MRQVLSLIADLLPDRRGNVLPLAAMGMLVAAGVIGSAIDLGRSYKVNDQLQTACDAAVLAGRRSISTNGYDSTAQAAAASYFATNFDSTAQEARSTSFVSSTPDNGNTVNGTATATIDTLILRIFNYNSFTLTATCGSSMGVGNADVMMVMDTTGSMNSTLSGSQTRIQALRAAMKNFYTTLANATAGTNARVRYGFVPYSSSVNVGRLLLALDPRYLVDTRTYQSRAYTSSTTTSNSSTTSTGWIQYSYTSYASSTSCATSLPPDDTDFSDSGNSSTTTTTSSGVTTTTVSQPQRMYKYKCQSVNGNKNTTYYYIYYMYYSRSENTVTKSSYSYGPIAYDTSTYKTFAATTTPTGTNGANVSSTWDGCIEERGTVAQSTFSYSPVSGITPTQALDLDLDAAPEVADDATKWAPMWPDVAYRRWDAYGNYTTATTAYGGEANSYCPVQAKLLAETSQTDFNAYADSLNAEGSTYLDIGMIWGGRMLSPDGIFTDNVNDAPRNGGEVSRHVIFMTDGVMEPNYLIQQAWGMEYWDRRVTSDGYTNDAARHTQRFLATCEAIKDKGIRVWVIAFTSGLSTDLKTCASDNSSYTANSSSELNTAFQEIAKQVGELRMVE